MIVFLTRRLLTFFVHQVVKPPVVKPSVVEPSVVKRSEERRANNVSLGFAAPGSMSNRNRICSTCSTCSDEDDSMPKRRETPKYFSSLSSSSSSSLSSSCFDIKELEEEEADSRASNTFPQGQRIGAKRDGGREVEGGLGLADDRNCVRN